VGGAEMNFGAGCYT